MSLVVVCGNCRQSYAAAPHLAGQQLACPACQSLMQVPSPPVYSPPAIHPVHAQPRLFAAGLSPAVQLSMAIGGGVVVLIALLIIVVAIATSSQGRIPHDPAGAVAQPLAPPLLPAFVASDGPPPPPGVAPPQVPTTRSADGFPLPLAASSKFPAWPRTHFGPCGCPVVVVEREVIEWKTGRKRTSLPWNENSRPRLSLSPGGQFVVAQNPSEFMYIYNTATGDRIFSVDRPGVDVLAFAGDLKMIAEERQTAPGALGIAEFARPQQAIQLRHSGDPQYFAALDAIAASPDGLEFAVVKHGSLRRFELSTGRLIDERQLLLESRSWLTYSPEGDELHVAISGSGKLHLTSWDRSLAVIDEFQLALGKPSANATFASLPGKAGWVFDHWLIDRRVKIPVVSFFSADDRNSTPRVSFADRDHVFINLPGLRRPVDADLVQGEFQLYRIPWDQIDASVAALARGDPALIGPGQEFSLRFNGASAAESPYRERAQESVKAKLANRGMAIREGAPASIEVSVRRWRDDGVNLETYTFDYLAGGQPLLAWRQEGVVRLDSLRPFTMPSASGTEQRTVQFTGGGDPAWRLEIPFFVPSATNLVALPIRIR